ncbi:MAG: hypothetical protein Q4C65_04750 [Eubacteriales bacterium]|nr:hypothetical protein [Eubacteriales bacterium]
MKNKYYMIGYTHIDPVWLWNRAEGMQEVKSSFASALARMEEFPDFKFTQTSAAFLAWLKENCPEEFEKIRERVREGRWELAGGMWIEPDCDLPSGEALIRQLLYGKDFFQKEFGVDVKDSLNPDSFGHGANLPAILAGCGIRSNTVSRPAKEFVELPAVFCWQSPDGSRLAAERTGGEYMAWTRPTMEYNLEESREGLAKIGYDKMAVFYGVGNHGGGPTIENLRAVCELRQERGKDTLNFSTLGAFYDETMPQLEALPVVKGELGRIYWGCYSSDRGIKSANRRAEWALTKAEILSAMAVHLGTDSWKYPAEKLEEAWKLLLFNQFHDILAGTSIETARDSACLELGAAAAMAQELSKNAVQAIANRIDTRGDGFPLVLVNPTGEEYQGVFEAEVYVPRAPKKPLRLRDPRGAEIYACESKYHNSAPESRKTILFEANIPACGFSVYRVLGEAPNDESARDVLTASPEGMDNGVVSLRLDPHTGLPCSVRKGSRELLLSAASVKVFYDDRGAWGETVFDGKHLGSFEAVSVRVVEANALRAVVRVLLTDGQDDLRIDYLLEKGSDVIRMRLRLANSEKHRLIALCLPLAESEPTVWTETAFLAEQKMDCRDKNPEHYQHRFSDLCSRDGSGLAVLNDGIYACMQLGNEHRLILSRSAVHARGGHGPLEETMENAFMDQGVWDYGIELIPHEKALSKKRLFAEADRLHMPPEYLGDSNHTGAAWAGDGRLFEAKAKNVAVSGVKESLNGPGELVVRAFETEGMGGSLCLRCSGFSLEEEFGPYQIRTFRLTKDGFLACDLLERPLLSKE